MIVPIIIIDDKRVRNFMGQIKDNHEIMFRNVVKKVVEKEVEILKDEIKTKHYFEGNHIAKNIRIQSDDKKFIVYGPIGLRALETGARPHYVSLKRHPQVKRWIMRKGKHKPSPYIGTKQHRLISNSIKKAHVPVQNLIKTETEKELGKLT